MYMGKRQTNRRRYSRRNRMRRTMRMTGGSCGCSGALHMKGGYGAASYSAGSLPPSSHYSLNNYNNDPSSSTSLISSRTLPNMIGGKRRRKTCGKCGKLMRGGSFDGVSSFGTTSGAWDLLHSLGGKVSPAPYDQPSVKNMNTLV